MTSIASLVAELVAAPRPVLCLDTCIFLDVITAGNRGLTDLIDVNRRLSDILVTTPDRIQLVVTSLVLREWISVEMRFVMKQPSGSQALINKYSRSIALGRGWGDRWRPPGPPITIPIWWID